MSKFEKCPFSLVPLQLSLSSTFCTHTHVASLPIEYFFLSSLKPEREVQTGRSAQDEMGQIGRTRPKLKVICGTQWQLTFHKSSDGRNLSLALYNNLAILHLKHYELWIWIPNACLPKFANFFRENCFEKFTWENNITFDISKNLLCKFLCSVHNLAIHDD